MRQKKFSPELTLLLILACALFLRGLFAVGISDPSDLINFDRVAQSAGYFKGGSGNFGSALQQARSELGGIRNFIFYSPSLLIYLIFGINQFSTLALSVTLSMASILVIYAICTLLTDNRVVGLLAALFWAVFPLDVFYSTAAPRITTMTFLFLLGILLILLAVKEGNKWCFGFASLVAMSLFLWESQLVLPWAIIAVFTYFSENTQKKQSVTPPKALLIVGVVICLLALLVWHPITLAFLDFYSLILDQPEMVFLLPLFFVAITVLAIDRETRVKKLLAWCLVVLIGYVVTVLSGSTSKPDLFSVGIFLQPLFAFLIILGAIYFSKDLGQRQGVIWISALAFLAASGAGLAVTGSRDFLPSFQGFDWIGLHSLFIIYSILGGIAFAGVMVSPYLITGSKRKWKTKARFALLAIILLAFLSYSWNRRNEIHYLSSAPAKALAYVYENETSLPIYAVSEETYQRLIYLSKMEDIFGDNHLSLSLISMDQIDQIQEGLILMFDDELTAPPPDRLWRVGAYGDLGAQRMVLYEMRSPQKANDWLLSARNADVKPIDTYGALINAGLPCEGYQVWKDSAQVDLSNIYFTPYSVQFDCLARGENFAGFDDLSNRSNLEGYIYFPLSSEDTLDMAQVTLPIYDMRTISVAVELQPNTLYLYSIDVKTTSSTATLYWRVGDEEDYLEMRSYPEWETVAALILTPDWETPETVSFSPSLFDHLDVVSVRNFFIGPVEITAAQP